MRTYAGKKYIHSSSSSSGLSHQASTGRLCLKDSHPPPELRWRHVGGGSQMKPTANHWVLCLLRQGGRKHLNMNLPCLSGYSRHNACCAVPCYVVLPQYLNITTRTLWGRPDTCDAGNVLVSTSRGFLVCCIAAIRGTDNFGLQRQPPAQSTAGLQGYL